MPWILLFVAGIFETGWAVALKHSDGLTRPGPSLATALALALSMTLLGWSLRHLPLGTAYAVWTGIGAVGTAGYGILFLEEPVGALRLLCLGLIIGGIAGLKLLTPA